MAEPPPKGKDAEPEREDSDSDPDAGVPLTMTASVVLGSLPRDAKEALREARGKIETRGGSGGGVGGKVDKGSYCSSLFFFFVRGHLHFHCFNLPEEKSIANILLMRKLTGVVTVHFRPIGSAPSLPSHLVKSKITATQPFSAVVRFLRKRLKLKDSEGVFCYLHSCFAPGLDEAVGGLFDVSFLSEVFLWAC